LETSTQIPISQWIKVTKDNLDVVKNDSNYRRWEITDESLFNIDNKTIFRDCTHIEKVIVNCNNWPTSDDLEYVIPESMFENCDSLETIVFLTSQNIKFTRIAKKAFKKCEKLLFISFGNADFVSSFGYIRTIEEEAFWGCKKLLILPGMDLTVDVDIGDKSFYNCLSLSSIDINAPQEKNINLKIGKKAFYGCRSLAYLCFYNVCIEEIKESAFDSCYSLKRFDINDKSKICGIGKRAFSHCNSLTDLLLILSESDESNNISIGKEAFASCTKLKNVEIIINNNNANDETKEAVAKACTHTIIWGKSAFQPQAIHSSLETITIKINCDSSAHEALYFENSTFHSCSKLKNINIQFLKKEPVACDLWFREFSLYDCNSLLLGGKKVHELFNLGKKPENEPQLIQYYDEFTFSIKALESQTGKS